MIIGKIHRHGQSHLAQIRCTLCRARRVLDSAQRWEHKSSQDADNGDYDQQLDKGERETTRAFRHVMHGVSDQTGARTLLSAAAS